ncbi:MAG: hypothetical protein IMW92_11875 [Bacillales bacterium]|nr:hypothetical protein [Bacillales bacterium]
MKKRKRPKFQIGDTVVVTIYGTVGVVTNMKHLDGEIVYEINKSEGLFKESSLVFLTEYEGGENHYERLFIEYKYSFGDLVRVKGCENALFKIVGCRTEIWRYKEDAWEDIIYEMTRIPDGEWLEAHEEELKLVADYEEAERILKKMELLLIPAKAKQKGLPAPESPEIVIDRLLDEFNDYQRLYSYFQDEFYRLKVKEIIEKLKHVQLLRSQKSE